MNQVWREIEEFLKANVPSVIETLNPPATESEILELEGEVGYSIPNDFKAFLLVHNGQEDPSRLQTLCEEGNLLSIQATIETYRMLNEINESDSVGPVEWWARKYLPVTDCEGDHLSIDLESGKIVMHVHDSEIERGIANSFTEWFDSKLAIFKEGKFSVDEGYLDYWEFSS